MTEIQALELLVGDGPQMGSVDLSTQMGVLRQRQAASKTMVDATRRDFERTRSELNEAINAETAAAASHSYQQALSTQYRDRLASERTVANSISPGVFRQAKRPHPPRFSTILALLVWIALKISELAAASFN